jgi:hypothetical protein
MALDKCHLGISDKYIDHQKTTHRQVVSRTYKALNSYEVARIELCSRSSKIFAFELFMIIYRGRRVPQALFVCFLQDSTRYPQVHL